MDPHYYRFQLPYGKIVEGLSARLISNSPIKGAVVKVRKTDNMGKESEFINLGRWLSPSKVNQYFNKCGGFVRPSKRSIPEEDTSEVLRDKNSKLLKDIQPPKTIEFTELRASQDLRRFNQRKALIS